MAKDDNINIKLEICKDKTSGDLVISTIFNPDAPNFSKDKDGYFWWPTMEEKDFLNDAFGLVSGKTPTKSTTTTSTTEKTTTPPPPPIETPEKDLQPEVKVEEEAVFEVTEEEKQQVNQESDEKKILVAADSHAIDEALKKNREKKEEGLVEVDEQTIVDKVLSQKKKGKWKK